jgi:hypothetical protein
MVRSSRSLSSEDQLLVEIVLAYLTQMVASHSAELVVGQVALADEQVKGVGLDDGTPPAGLGAERAIALGRTLTQIDVRLVADCSAVATSLVCPLHL